MKSIIKSIATCTWLLISAAAQEPARDDLASLSQIHQKATTELEGQRTAELARLRQPYLEALVAADQVATKAGDGAALRAIEQERDAVNQGKLRAELSKALPRKLSPIRRAVISGESRLHADFDKRRKTLDAEYLKKLGALQTKASTNAALAEQITREKMRVASGINGAITDLKSELAGTKWRLFQGEGFEQLRFGEDGKVNGNWKYEIVDRDKVSVVWDKSSSMNLTLGKDGASLTAGDKIWVVDRN